MKFLKEMLDYGDVAMAHAADARQQKMSGMASATKGYWLLDKRSGKKLSGPFKDYASAESFQENRKDRIPSDAVIREV
jgi:hypothetical protein